MYIRTVKSHKSTCFQIGYKENGQFVLVKHIGCTISPKMFEVLKLKAQEELNNIIYAHQPFLFPENNTSPSPVAKLIKWHIRGFHDYFGTIYDSIGFPQGLLRDLVIARIVYPYSKLATIRYLKRSIGINLSIDKVYRFLDKLNKDKLTKIAFDFIKHKNQEINLVFYDVTTLYFETDNEDSLRKKGYSKDHKIDSPQILVGLFIDENGYPFDFDFFKGNTFEGHTFPIIVERIMSKYSLAQLTVVTDAGMLSDDNLNWLESKNINYIVGARIKSIKNEFKDRIFSHDFINIPQYEIKLNNRRLIIDYSETRAKRDRLNRDKLIKKIIYRINHHQPLIRKSKYLKTEKQDNILSLNYEQIENDKKYDGLKGYVSNRNNNLSLKEIIKQYHNLWKVEKAFRMSKNDLKERPIYHRNLKRIESHLSICFCSLLIMKEAENILKKINLTLPTAIEILSSVGQGKVKINGVELPLVDETSDEAKLIFKTIKGH